MKQATIDEAVNWIAEHNLIGNLRLIQALLDQADTSIRVQNDVADLLNVEPLQYGEGY